MSQTTKIDKDAYAIVSKKGRIVRLAGPGEIRMTKNMAVETLGNTQPLTAGSFSFDQLSAADVLRDMTTDLTVKEGEIALHFFNDSFCDVLPAGAYKFWVETGVHRFQILKTDQIQDLREVSLQPAAHPLVKQHFHPATVEAGRRAVVFDNGEPVAVLDKGYYLLPNSYKSETSSLRGGVSPEACTADTLLRSVVLKDRLVSINVKEGEVAFHMVNGDTLGTLFPGTHLFWSDAGQHKFRILDTNQTFVPDDVSPSCLTALDDADVIFTRSVEVGCQGLLLIDNKVDRVLDPGVYHLFFNGKNADILSVDTRLNTVDISGQEILTRDKVPIRVNLTVNYRITDVVRSVTEVGNLKDQIHLAAQFAVRAYIGQHELDELLDNKDDLNTCVRDYLHSREAELFVRFGECGVKDIILPGDIRDIMSTVLVAQKQAQANVIKRREEVASTRCLLNTAKLMDDNPTLYKLKALEHLESMLTNVQSLNVSGIDAMALANKLLSNGTLN